MGRKRASGWRRAVGTLGAAASLSLQAGEPSGTTSPLSRYEVVARDGARELTVEAVFPRGSSADLVLPDGHEGFVQGAELEGSAGWRQLARRGDTLNAPECPRSGCRVRYRFALAEAARGGRDRDQIFEHNGVYVAPLRAWMIRPLEGKGNARLRLHVETPVSLSFVTGVAPAPDGAADTYETAFDDLAQAPYSAFGPFERSRLPVGGAVVDLAVSPGPVAAGKDGLVRWASTAAHAVAGLYGRFPVPRLAVIVLTGGRRAVGFGTTMGNGGASILIWVGRDATEEQLRKDWVLTHEMIHTAFPNVPRNQTWIEEGLATYLESFARARAGLLSPEEAWGGLAQGLPKGLPEPGDRGLDRTATWGRTYWGGALFAFVADLEIRERTDNRRSLDDALKGILAAGGSIAVSWDLERALRAGDAATGVPVLASLHARWGVQPVAVDLDAIWKRLGVVSRGGPVVFDDVAPLAGVRRSFTAARAPTP